MPSGRERVIRALCLEESDRVPLGGDGVSQPTADVVLGRPCVMEMGGELRRIRLWAAGRVKELQERIMADIYDLAEKLKLDLTRIGVGFPAEDDPRPKMLDENSWTWDGTIIYRLVPGNYMVAENTPTGEYPTKSVEDFEEHVKSLESVGDKAIERDVQRLLAYGGLMKRLVRELKICVYYPIWNAFLTRPWWLPTFLKCFYVRPDLIRRFEQAQARRAMKLGSVAIDLGCDIIGIGGDLAYRSGPMISPRHYHEFIMPYMRMESDHFHKEGAFTMIASDGNLWPIIEDYLINSHVDAMREIESRVMDIEKLKELYGDRICFNGAVDCATTLVYGSPEDVKEETKRCIETLSPGGGHILSSTNSINPQVKPENFFAMLEAHRKYGKYTLKH